MTIKNKYGVEITMAGINRAYGEFKELYNYYLNTKDIAVGKEEMCNRVKHIMKRKVNQRTEVETICWILGMSLEDILNEEI